MTEQEKRDAVSGMKEEEKRDAILQWTEDSFFVEAGAGAGKTTLIVNRIINQLRKGEYKAEEFVVITFTNKAAEELRDRILRELQDAEEAALGEEKKRLQEAFSNMDKMTISTIHSFCIRLLKERALDTGLRMDMEKLEGEEEQAEKKRIFGEWFRSRGDIIERFQTMQKLHSGLYNQNSCSDTLFGLFSEICELPKNTEFPVLEERRDILKKDPEQYTKELQKKLEEDFGSQQGFFLKEVDSKLGKKYGSLKNLNDDTIIYKKIYEAWTVYQRFDRLPKDVLNLSGAFIKGNKTTKKDKHGVEVKKTAVFQAEVKGIMDEAQSDALNDAWKAHIKKNIAPEDETARKRIEEWLYISFLELAVDARNYFREHRGYRFYTNDSLLQQARSLVFEKEEAREFFRKKYKTFYVDEFQDTDEVQAEMIWKLCEDSEGNLRRGSLFFVGDPKQAIYRFRGGDVTVYQEYREKMEKEGLVCELQNNFRSNEKVTGWVNEEYKKRLDAYMPMIAKKNCSPDVGKNKVIGGVYHQTDVAEDAPERLAALIHTLVAEKYPIEVTVKKKEKFVRKKQQIQYQDFLVLAWNTSKMPKYLAEMKKKKIPVQFSGKSDLSENKIIGRFIALYAGLADTKDKTSGAAAMEVLLGEALTQENREKGRKRLSLLRKLTTQYSGYELLYFLLDRREIILPKLEGKEIVVDSDILQNISKKLIQMVETVLSDTMDNKAEITEALYRYQQKKLEREISLEKEDSSVRFMNVHKAKGLEGNIVILLRNNEEAEFRKTTYQSRNEGVRSVWPVLELRSGYGISKIQLTSDEGTEKAARLAELDDRWRLEYVAATRAAEALFLMPVSVGRSKKAEKFPCFSEETEKIIGEELKALLQEKRLDYRFDAEKIKKFCPAETENEELYKVLRGEAVGGRAQANSNEDAAPAALDVTEKWRRKEPDEEQKKPVYSKLSPSSLEREMSVLNGVADAPKGRLFGLIMHRAFELFVNRAGGKWKKGVREEQEQQLISSCINQASQEFTEELSMERFLGAEVSGDVVEGTVNSIKKELEEIREELSEIMQGYFGEGFLQEYQNENTDIYTELPFSFYISREKDQEFFEDEVIKEVMEKRKIEIGEEPVWFNGTADLVLVDPEKKRCLVVDYKSDVLPEEESEISNKTKEKLWKKYGGQLRSYRYAMSRIFGVDKKNVKLCLYTRKGVVWEDE